MNLSAQYADSDVPKPVGGLLESRALTDEGSTRRKHDHLLAADPIRQGAGIVLVGVYYVCTREY
eukprot:CAMPEP_0179481208 /NCGR_PEP_ID=MMETSP0799-20121207/59003_1 /TAXON_ID=46947 /ORGANISM="Geminigera cryophila, Strain CCMP2564" /LENGTH=63 /DNA_ID=CAMNT_0021293719 /DNA_START=201 /DNA_END=392 /DNA_ORIENTATION=-